MNTAADRERFDKMAADLESELEGAEGAESQSSVARTHRKTRSKRMELPKCSPRLQTRMIPTQRRTRKAIRGRRWTSLLRRPVALAEPYRHAARRPGQIRLTTYLLRAELRRRFLFFGLRQSPGNQRVSAASWQRPSRVSSCAQYDSTVRKARCRRKLRPASWKRSL